MSSNKEFIIKEIEKSGFPLELEVMSFFSNMDDEWFIFPRDYYYDEDEKKGRDIDFAVQGMDHFASDGFNGKDFRIVIECKKTLKNWVFFPVDCYMPQIDGQILTFLVDQQGTSIENEIANEGYLHHDYAKHKISYNYNVVPSNTDKNELWTGIMQVIKYVSYQRNKFYNILNSVKDSKDFMVIWYPVIIVDGKMWNVYYENGRIVDAEETQHALIQTQYKSRKSIEPESFTVDVVHRSHIKDFFNKLVEDSISTSRYIDSIDHSFFHDSRKNDVH